jgi:hypothetical protein
VNKKISIILTFFLLVSQIYWLPSIDKISLDIVKIISLTIFFFSIVTKEYFLREKNIFLILILLLIFTINFDYGMKFYMIFSFYAFSSQKEEVKLNSNLLLLLSIIIFTPSLSYFFNFFSDFYEPFKYFETHYNWLSFYEVGFSGLSTGYGYSITFILSLLLNHYKGRFLFPIVFFGLMASYLTGSFLSIIFSIIVIISHFKKIKVYLILIIFIVSFFLIGKDMFYELGNNRFEMYDYFDRINFLELVFFGNENLLLLDNDLKFHNGYLSLIIETGVMGSLIVIFILIMVFQNLKVSKGLVTPLFIFFMYNLFEPSNVFGNWGSLVPLWWYITNTKTRHVRNTLQ